MTLEDLPLHVSQVFYIFGGILFLSQTLATRENGNMCREHPLLKRNWGPKAFDRNFFPAQGQRELLVASLLVAMPGAPSSVLAPTPPRARKGPSRFLC